MATVFKATAALLLLAASSHASPAGPPAPAVRLAGAQLQALGASASSFCTSFVGGVTTKTSTVSASTSTQVTETNTITESVAGPTAFETLTESYTVTETPSAQTITAAAVTETVTVTASAADYASTCGVTQAPAAGLAGRGLQPHDERGLFDVIQGVQGPLNGLLRAFASPIIASACSAYVIKTPTATATTTSTKIGTLTVPATVTATGNPSTITNTESATETQTLLPETVTEFPTSTLTFVSTPCATGLACNDGTCRCPSGLYRCPTGDRCVVPTIVCPSFNQPGAFGQTNSGETADGNGFCTYGYGSINGGAVYCVYVPSTGALLSRQVEPRYNSLICPASIAPFTPACS